MSIFSRFLRTMSSALTGVEPTVPAGREPYEPTVKDVLDVKDEIFKSSGLPLELIDTIIDLAEYWPRTSVRRTGQPGLSYRVSSGRHENHFLLRSYPLGYIPGKKDITEVELGPQRSYVTTYHTPSSVNEDPHDGITPTLISEWSEKIRAADKFACRKIVFTIRSHDQGYCDNPDHRGNYDHSYTWFDVGHERLCSDTGPQDSQISERVTQESVTNPSANIHQQAPILRLPISESNAIRDSNPEYHDLTTRTILPSTNVLKDADNHDIHFFEHPLLPTPQCLQRNRTATSNYEDYKITWHYNDRTDPDSIDGKALDDIGRGNATGNGEFVRNLKVGDVVTIWAKSRFPGWINYINELGIDVYWAV